MYIADRLRGAGCRYGILKSRLPWFCQGCRRHRGPGCHRYDAVHRCQSSGAWSSGWCGHHPVCPALARLQPGQVDPLSLSQLYTKYVCSVCGELRRPGLSGGAASVAGGREGVAGRHAVLLLGFFLLMPWWSRLVKPSLCPSVSPSSLTEAGENKNEETDSDPGCSPGIAGAARF